MTATTTSSCRRGARAVGDYLRGLGVAPTRITIVAVGESQATIEPAQANRRVVIFGT